MGIELSQPRSRRGLLTGALGAVAGAAAATFAGARAVLAAGDDGKAIHVGDYLTDIRSETFLDNQTNGNPVLSVSGMGPTIGAFSYSNVAIGATGANDHGIVGSTIGSQHAGVVGRATAGITGRITGAGVYGAVTQEPLPNPAPNTGVFACNSEPKGVGVYGQVSDMGSATVGVKGTALGQQGVAVLGVAANLVAGGTGVWGQSSNPTGVGVRGFAWDGGTQSASFGTGVLGSSGSPDSPPPKALANTGVAGISQRGPGVYGNGNRGGVFAGVASQIRLAPSSAASHPPSGFAGDLFVDSSSRLWFCQGGTTWRQVPLV